MATNTPPEFQLEYIPIDELRVDHKYQREYNHAAAQALAAKFDWNRFFPANGSRRNGHVYLTDGQTRRGALTLRGYKGKVPVIVRSGLTIEEEATQFLAQDDRKGISLVEKHTARLVAKDPVAIGVQKVLDDVGVEIHRNAGTNRTKAPAELYRIYKEYSADVLKRTLLLIREQWGPEEFGMAEIRAVGRLYGNASANFDEKRLNSILGKNSHADWLKAASGVESGNRPNLGDSLWRAITMTYNHRLPMSKRI